jgi:hypothetical protein
MIRWHGVGISAALVSWSVTDAYHIVPPGQSLSLIEGNEIKSDA